MPSYKDAFYAKYVSTHNARLYGPADLARVRKQFPAWDQQYARFLPKDNAGAIADLGCGEGGLVAWLHAAEFRNAEGVDVSAEQIAAGKAMGIDGLVQEDLRTYLKAREGRFQLIFLRDVLGHFPKEEVLEVVELAHKALLPGGMLVVKTPNAESPMTGRLRYGDFTHDTSFTGTSLRQLLEVQGFKDVRIYSMRPVVHGLVSAVRYVLWLGIELKLRLYRLVEAGSPRGCFTQNVTVTGTK